MGKKSNASASKSKSQVRKKKKLTKRDLQNATLQTYQKAKANMKVNVQKQYLPKMAEFLKWCELQFSKSASDWDWVTGLKLHKFLADEVIDRASRKKKKEIAALMMIKTFNTLQSSSTSRPL